MRYEPRSPMGLLIIPLWLVYTNFLFGIKMMYWGSAMAGCVLALVHVLVSTIIPKLKFRRKLRRDIEAEILARRPFVLDRTLARYSIRDPGIRMRTIRRS
jgi:hypothetical protein